MDPIIETALVVCSLAFAAGLTLAITGRGIGALRNADRATVRATGCFVAAIGASGALNTGASLFGASSVVNKMLALVGAAAVVGAVVLYFRRRSKVEPPRRS